MDISLGEPLLATAKHIGILDTSPQEFIIPTVELLVRLIIFYLGIENSFRRQDAAIKSGPWL